MLFKKTQNLKLPSLPNAVRECMAQLYNSAVDILKLSTIVQKDTGLTSSLLKLANSTFYSTGKPTSDLNTGITRIGLTFFMQILVSHSLESIFNFDPIHFFSIKSFTKHASWASQIAFEIGKLTKSTNLSDLLVAGLFHDVGLLVRVIFDYQLQKKIIEKLLEDKSDFYSAEKMLGLESHSSLGCELLKLWLFPEEVIEIVRYHHTEEVLLPKNLSQTLNQNIQILKLSDLLAHRFGNAFSNYPKDVRVNQIDLDKLGLTNQDISKVIQSATMQLQYF